MLCSNRFPLPGSPSTCTLDTAIVPVPSFLLLLALAGVLRWRRAPADPAHPAPPPRWLHIAYMVLVAAAFAMTVLELARLGAAQLGVGLLPVAPVALLAVFIVLWRQRQGRSQAVSLLFLAYWVVLVPLEALKCVRLQRLEVLDPTTAKTSNYPSSDQFLDNAVMLGLWVVFMGVEIVMLVLARRSNRAYDSYKLQG